MSGGVNILAGATIADFSTILLLSLVFAESGGSTVSRLLSIGWFALFALSVGAA